MSDIRVQSRNHDPQLSAIALAALRSIALIAISIVLVLVVLPAVLGAAGAQVAIAP